VQNLKLKKFAVAYDASNRAFTETWLNFFKQVLLANGGKITFVEEFFSRPDVSFLPMAERMLATEPEGVLLLSNAIDTAMLAQQIRKLESEVALFSSEWASTTDLLSFGGRAVNGMVSFHSFNANSQEARYLSFKEKFTKRFGYAPSFATSLAYDAASFLFAGLEKNPSRNGLKEALLNLGSFPGLQSEMTVDKYGDVERKLFLTVIENGQFEVVE
jgi:branched-chain amino acid transport system substrate-binding protein